MVRYLVKFIMMLFFLQMSYGACINNVDDERYYKLQTSNVRFNSVKGGSFFVAIGFNKSDWVKYLSGQVDSNRIIGCFRIHSLTPNQKMKPIDLLLKDKYWDTVFSVGDVEDMLFAGVGENFILSNNSSFGYLIVPEIYLSKDIPNNLNNIIEVFEKNTIK